MKRLLILLIPSALLLAGLCHAQTTFTVTATASPQDDGAITGTIQELHDNVACSDGDTIDVPAGSYIVNSTGLQFTKSIKINGIGAVTITNEIPGGFNRPPLFAASLAAGQQTFTWWMHNIDFYKGSAATAKRANAECNVTGAGAYFKITNCSFNDLRGPCLNFNGPYGVVYESYISSGMSPGNSAGGAQVQHKEAFGGNNGHGPWQNDIDYGGLGMVYFDKCTFEGQNNWAIDGFQGAMAWYRYSNFIGCNWVKHGTEGQGRGTRFVGFAHCTINYTGQMGHIRSGKRIAFGTRSENLTAFALFKNYRMYHDTAKWGGTSGGAAGGESVYDLNDPEPTNGYWFQGTHVGGTADEVFNVPGAGMTPDQFVATDGSAFILINATRANEEGFTWFDRIFDNGTETIETSREQFGSEGTAQYIPPLTWNNGDVGQVWKVLRAIDQTGVGKGDEMTGLGTYGTGSAAKLVGTQAPGYPNQEDDPSYSWDEQMNGSPAGPSAATGMTILEGRDFFNEVANVHGTFGVEVGDEATMLSRMPSTVGSWFIRTDLGTWNSVTPADNFQAFEWDGALWQFEFEPLAFPHPFITGEAADTDPPTPTPMTFDGALTVSGPSSISGTATTASDATTPILYQVRWDETGLTDWTETSEQGSTSFIVSELVPDTTYDFQVRARDANGNYTAWSATLSATTGPAPSVEPGVTANLIITGTLNANQ